MVETARRAWPGINQPGGLAKITKLNYSSSNLLTSVDVFYPVERRSESHVEMQWITVRSNFMENAVKHGGSARGAKGRCSRCGSLRRDCGECDWKFEEEQRRLALLPQPQPQPQPKKILCEPVTQKKKKKREKKRRHKHTSSKNSKSQLENLSSLSSRFAKNAASSDPSDFLSDSDSSSSSDSDDTAELLQPYKSQITSDASATSTLGDYLNSDDDSISTLGDYLDDTDDEDWEDENSQNPVDNSFIQPEGDPTTLPSDLQKNYDVVSQLPFQNLFEFYDKTTKKIQNKTLPDCMLKFSNFVQKTRSNPTPPSSTKIELEKENLQMFSIFQKKLLFEGKDLLRECLRRLSSKRELNKFKRSISEDKWVRDRKMYSSLQLEILEMKYDELDEKIEQLLQDCKSHLCSFFPEQELDPTLTQQGGDSLWDDDNNNTFNDEDENYNFDPTQTQPKNQHDDRPLEAHPHASRKRDPNRTLPAMSSLKQNRKEKRRRQHRRNGCSTQPAKKRRNEQEQEQEQGNEGSAEREPPLKRRKRRTSKSSSAENGNGNRNENNNNNNISTKTKSKPEESVAERMTEFLEKNSGVNATILKMLKMLKPNKHLNLANLPEDKRLMVLNLLTVAAKLIPNLAPKCALPIVDLIHQDPSSLASSFSLREALSQIPIEIMSTVLLKFYDGVIGVVPEDLFDDADAPLAVKSQAAILANAPRSTINIIYILLGSAAKPDVGACCAMTWKVICLLLFGNAGTLANKFFTNLTDISSNDDELGINPEHFSALEAEMNWIVKLPACSDDAAVLKIFKRMIQIVSVCPERVCFRVVGLERRGVKKWLKMATFSSSFDGEGGGVPLEMSPLPRNMLTSPVIQLLRHHFKNLGTGKAKKKRCFNAFAPIITQEPKGPTELEIAQYAACLGGLEGVWTWDDVWKGVLERSWKGGRAEETAQSLEIKAKITAAMLSSNRLSPAHYEKCLTTLSTCISESSKLLLSAIERENSGAGMLDDNEKAEVEKITDNVAIIVGQFISSGVTDLREDMGVEALKGVLQSGGIGISVVLRSLKVLISFGVSSLRRIEGKNDSRENSNPNEISFDEFGGDLDFGDMNLDLVLFHNSLAKIVELKGLVDLLKIVLNEVRPSALFSLNVIGSAKIVGEEGRFEATKRIDDLISIYSGLLALTSPDSSFQKDVKESLLDSKDLIAKYHDSGWTLDLERRFFVRLCSYKVESSSKIVRGGWISALNCLVTCLVDYNGLECYESVEIGDLDLRDKLKRHIAAARDFGGGGFDADSAGVKFGKSGVFGCLWTWLKHFSDVMNGEDIGAVLEEVLRDVGGEGGGVRGSLEREVWKRGVALTRLCEFCVETQDLGGRLTVVSSVAHGLIGGMKQFCLGEAMMGGKGVERIKLLKGKFVEGGRGDASGFIYFRFKERWKNEQS
ncbi:hypothetical protein TrLO_g15465 [Triparma laevis f. longispina]|uniref:Uncharacterized protein n=1 Tax=Triparma laevis f. longispina TaxID=1714387 RepID=A0A9W7CDC1_9STRA|nr:hypothetical protein TrLO_g15465 [Triparma laevis f. longispina]